MRKVEANPSPMCPSLSCPDLAGANARLGASAGTKEQNDPGAAARCTETVAGGPEEGTMTCDWASRQGICFPKEGYIDNDATACQAAWGGTVEW